MTIPLKLIFETINQAPSEHELRLQVVPQIGEYFAAKRYSIFFFEQLSFTTNKNLQKILKIALSIEHNPIARYLVERHAPVHEALVMSPKAWNIICPRRDHWHVMAGPIINRHQLVGVVGCTREKSMPAFDTQNLTDLSSICLHLSVWAATVDSQFTVTTKSQYYPFQSDACGGLRQRLTPRELQIAQLVASGLTNAEIGHQLWITENSVKQALKRMFRKLEVSSRAEMVAQLLARKHYSPEANLDSLSNQY
ncbi:LuxR C-terminal-related transcriptional regulator [Nostoc parmelioides]|uniref:LuxR family transcriptional regulator n=1 Tax=Nostoc parmelioides FACHB-3921 TaxID=2692909 RepID=A0ABR8BPU7_9NOSO|nr:LuxR C-terminal-related transcriptional regulator [Nostoc parmelioides]MBD2255886.1 LuxR family transcriptional regulator [Nostoc parmelioides FACHB-3921]